MTTEPPIVTVIRHYYPDWEVPDDQPGWIKTLCPFHGDGRKSASVSFELNSFRCFACDARGDVVTLIMREEETTYAEAKRRAASILGESYQAVSRQPGRKPCRRVFGDEGADGTVESIGDRPVPAGIRERTPPWA